MQPNMNVRHMDLSSTFSSMNTLISQCISQIYQEESIQIFFSAHRIKPTEEKRNQLLKQDLILPEQLYSSFIKRQVEFLTGRLCAREALIQAGCIPHRILKISEHRYPLWPSHIAGSITHCDDLAISMVSHDCQNIGIYVEMLMLDEVAHELSHVIVNKEERSLGVSLGLSQSLWLTLVFSAKESLFKALYPKTHIWLDFKDCEIDRVDQHRKCLEMTIQHSAFAQQTFEVFYRIHKAHIMTISIIR